MGAGCHYTLNENRNIKAYWIDINRDESDDDDGLDSSFMYDMVVEDIQNQLQDLPLFYMNGNTMYYGKHYKIELESTYYGDGIVIQLGIDLNEYDQVYPLMAANLEKVYNKIMKRLNKSFDLRIATSGYTSALVPVNSLH